MQTVFSRLCPALKWMFLALALGACFGVQAQQSWPNRPIRLLVPYPPGGSTDILTRLLGQKLSESLGQPVIVENRGGASGGVGSAGHLLNELFKANVGINLLHVPYKGNAPAMLALIAGDVQFTTDNLPQLLPQIRTGKLQPLAVTSPTRWFQLPEVPTVGEAGFPNMTTTAWFGLVAQSKTSPEVIARINRELVAILQKPDFIARLREVSFEALPGTPDDMTAAARKERELWKKVVEMSGAKAE